MGEIIEFLVLLTTNYGVFALIGVLLAMSIPLLLIGLLVLYFSNVGKSLDKKIAERLSESKKTHIKGNKIRRVFEEGIKDNLTDLAKVTCADRALVLEYSNGTSNLVGVPFLYATATAEVVTPGTDLVSTQYQRIPLNLFSGFVYRIEREGFIFISDLESIKCAHPILYKMLKENEVREIAFAAIQGEDEVVGIVVVSSVGENRLWTKYLENELHKFANKISVLFAFEKQEYGNDKKWFKWFHNR